MKLFYDLTKASKLQASFAALVALSAFMGVFAIIQLGQLESKVADLETRRLPSIRAVLGMKSDLTRLRVEEQQHILVQNEAEMAKYEKLMDATLGDFKKKQEQYARLVAQPDEKRIYLEVIQLWDRYMAEHAKTLVLSRQNHDADSRSFIESESRRLYTELNDRFDQLADSSVTDAIRSGQGGTETYSTSRFLILGLLAGSFVIGMAAFVMRGQARRAADLGHVNRSLSEEIAFRKESEETLRQFSIHQEKIREDERKRIASEIHDELGQNLLALRMDVSLLHARTRPNTRLNKRAGYALHTIDLTIDSVRGIIGNLRPAVLNLGLPAAIEWQLREFERINRIACKISVNENEFDADLNNDRTVAVFRILQESLANTARHAQATEIMVELGLSDSRISMTVKDNGVGFQLVDRRKANTFGLIAIKERVKSLGGELFIDSSDGTVLSISIPIA